jgi:WhiB family redox-sensing transcriptional regulator
MPPEQSRHVEAEQAKIRSVGRLERIGWVSKALCRSVDPEELFVRGAAQREAAEICRHCPVMRECAADALDNEMEFGVWGGMTERERRRLVKKNPGVLSWADFLC